MNSGRRVWTVPDLTELRSENDSADDSPQSSAILDEQWHTASGTSYFSNFTFFCKFVCAFNRSNDSSGFFHSYRRELTFEYDKLMKSLVVAQVLVSLNFELIGSFLEEV